MMGCKQKTKRGKFFTQSDLKATGQWKWNTETILVVISADH